MPKTIPPRLFRRTTPEFFPEADIVAVHDQVDNIVHFNTAFSGDASLENAALFMDRDGKAPVLRFQPKQLFTR
jgi:hypothetical protein